MSAAAVAAEQAAAAAAAAATVATAAASAAETSAVAATAALEEAKCLVSTNIGVTVASGTADVSISSTLPPPTPPLSSLQEMEGEHDESVSSTSHHVAALEEAIKDLEIKASVFVFLCVCV